MVDVFSFALGVLLCAVVALALPKVLSVVKSVFTKAKAVEETVVSDIKKVV